MTEALSRILRVLGCVAADPGSSGVLFLDLDPALLMRLALRLAERLDTGSEVVVLGSHLGEEDLWCRTRFTGDGFAISPGLLVEEPGTPQPVLVVPDLRRAGVSVARAAVSLAGSEAASAEMHGHSFRWRPRARWLAAVDRAEVGSLSPHLLDRFPIRVDGSGLRPSGSLDVPGLPAPAARGVPRMTSAAAEQITMAVPARPGMRRELAVGRLARGLAAIEGSETVEPSHVTEAVSLLGLARPAETDPEPEPDGRRARPRPRPRSRKKSRRSNDGRLRAAGPEAAHVVDPGPAQPLGTLDAGLSDAAAWPYPEEDPEALPLLGSLKGGHTGRVRARQGSGQAVGVRPATNLRDLALIATVVEAAKSLPVRRLHGHAPSGRLTIGPGDLREYRRRPEPSSVLVLVLDHSCWTGRDPGAYLAPYLRWAYRGNAALSVIEFGGLDAPAELRAERYQAASVLDRRIPGSLDRRAGTASPLAHALDLAVQEIRRHVRRRRDPVEEIILLVATDARGNVPLADSLRGSTPRRVGRRGIEDALSAAAPVRRLAPARAVVLAPERDQYAGLPFDLAEAMGGRVVLVPDSGGAP